MSLEILLIISFGGTLMTYILGKVSDRYMNILAVAVSLSLVVFVACLYGRFVEKTFFKY